MTADEQEPRGVRLIVPGGSVIACDVLRDEDADEGGVAAWMVVPREPLPSDGGGWRIEVDLLPSMCALHIAVPDHWQVTLPAGAAYRCR